MANMGGAGKLSCTTLQVPVGNGRSNNTNNSCKKEQNMSIKVNPPAPKVSHHQPCPNHASGRIFAEIGTQTLPRPKKQSADTAAQVPTGCAAALKKRYFPITITRGSSASAAHNYL
jgi:hypothetical protein